MFQLILLGFQPWMRLVLLSRSCSMFPVMAGKYIPHLQLRPEWLQITGAMASCQETQIPYLFYLFCNFFNANTNFLWFKSVEISIKTTSFCSAIHFTGTKERTLGNDHLVTRFFPTSPPRPRWLKLKSRVKSSLSQTIATLMKTVTFVEIIPWIPLNYEKGS